MGCKPLNHLLLYLEKNVGEEGGSFSLLMLEAANGNSGRSVGSNMAETSYTNILHVSDIHKYYCASAEYPQRQTSQPQAGPQSPTS